MPETRPTTRHGGACEASPKDGVAAGTKRKVDKTSSPTSSHKQKAPKKQATIEETIGDDNKVSEDKETKDVSAGPENTREEAMTEESKEGNRADEKDEAKEGARAGEENGTDKAETNGSHAIEELSQREPKLPSNILEKGIIYFFVRNRVGIEDADSVSDLQRTYFVLRPLPAGAKIGDGALQDLENNRLFALPKKVLPKSHRDRFMAFVEKANTSIQDLKDNFFKGAEYETQTAGTRRLEPVTPVGEGVYAITRTEDRTTHLAYAITIPSDMGEVQQDLGLRSQGSFIMSVKNPERPGPASARLPQGPEYPKEIVEEFRGLAWTEVKPKYLDYPNTQILLIGENTKHAVEATQKDKKHGKGEPKRELERLEHEDELRVNHLHGDDSVFDDLGISKKDYPQVPTTW
ncbi:hypothetical protein CC78DRAFT_145693 [Lojkania enalia]|uniref:BTB domain transcription factor n=1 Tax=Lojkania enalia TaxID=147567 RepID=A0A9P4JYM4_9PLEO|nr:hypothetical protein CC78DRAFT_145693 [Didymosphaeria enalia]